MQTFKLIRHGYNERHLYGSRDVEANDLSSAIEIAQQYSAQYGGGDVSIYGDEVLLAIAERCWNVVLSAMEWTVYSGADLVS